MSDSVDLTPNCCNCRYSVTGQELELTCRRYAPRPSSGESLTHWPEVLDSDWCGEWTLPPTDDELFADYLARSAEASVFEGIPVLPSMPTANEATPDLITYDEPFEDPLK